MRPCFLPLFCFFFFQLAGQPLEDPSAVKPYRLVVQTGISLQWFDKQFKTFSVSAERPLNLYNHIGVQADFFFPEGPFEYRSITGDSYEVGVFAKSFFHGRLTGRRSKTYIGPDIRFGKRIYNIPSFFGNEPSYERATTFKLMVRVGWQYHLGNAVIEVALPFGNEKENIGGNFSFSGEGENNWFVATPAIYIGYGF